MDDALRIGLWNVLKVYVWDTASSNRLDDMPRLHGLCQALWFSHFKQPLDAIEVYWPNTLQGIRDHFFKCAWFDVYDFVEFVGDNFQFFGSEQKEFYGLLNAVLERELAAFRVVDGVISPVTTEVEIEAIELAIRSASEPVAAHLRRALEMLSDKTAPDYRNSVKESISAVESLVIRVTGEKKGTLGQLIKKLSGKTELHPALQSAFSSLYGYTSSESGVRHALIDSGKVDFNDAKFMLVVCSAFVGFVDGKQSRS